MTRSNDVLLFETREPRIQSACPVDSQFYTVEDDTYYRITRIVENDGIYAIYGTPITIPELTDDILDHE